MLSRFTWLDEATQVFATIAVVAVLGFEMRVKIVSAFLEAAVSIILLQTVDTVARNLKLVPQLAALMAVEVPIAGIVALESNDMP